MPLSECVKKTTNREYLLWNRWLDEQWDEPDRHDHYIMDLSMQVASILNKKASSLKLSMFKLKFGSTEDQEKEDVEKSKSRWRSWLGKK